MKLLTILITKNVENRADCNPIIDQVKTSLSEIPGLVIKPAYREIASEADLLADEFNV